MNPRTLKYGDIVQLDPNAHLPTGDNPTGGFFAGCLMLITEPKPWGAQGFISMPGDRGTMPGQAYFRAKWEEMEYVGRATWIPRQDPEED